MHILFTHTSHNWKPLKVSQWIDNRGYCLLLLSGKRKCPVASLPKNSLFQFKRSKLLKYFTEAYNLMLPNRGRGGASGSGAGRGHGEAASRDRRKETGDRLAVLWHPYCSKVQRYFFLLEGYIQYICQILFRLSYKLSR